MGDAFALPSDPKTFNPGGAASIPVSAPSAPHLGKVFQFDPIVPRRPRPMPEAPEPEVLDPMPMAPPVPPGKPPVVATAAAPDSDEPEKKISADRLAFLERVEALVGAESRISDLERENQALISIVSRQQKELETLRKGAPKA